MSEVPGRRRACSRTASSRACLSRGKSMSLKYEPASEPLHISLCVCLRVSDTVDGVSAARAHETHPRVHHPGGNPGSNLKSISHRCHPILVAIVWELTKESIDLSLGRRRACSRTASSRACLSRGFGITGVPRS